MTPRKLPTTWLVLLVLAVLYVMLILVGSALGATLNVDTNGNLRVPSNFPTLLVLRGPNMVMNPTNTGNGWGVHVGLTNAPTFDASVLIGSNLVLQGTITTPTVTGTNNGILWASNNTLWWTYTAGGTTTNTAKVGGP